MYFERSLADKSLANYLKQEASEIKTILKRTVENTIEIGRRLTKIKKTLPHGDFYPWIEQEIGLHSSTVLHFMRVWQTFGDCREQISQLGLNVSILYVLSAPSTPEELRSKVLTKAQKGEPVSIAEVKQLKKEYELRKSDLEPNKTIEVEQTTRLRDSQDDEMSKTSLDISTIPDEVKIITEPKPKQQIVGIVRQEKFYNLGKHLLYNGLPQSPDFVAHLPSKLSLCLGFPTQPDWTKASLVPVDSQTTIVHDSEIRDDLDIFILSKSIEKSIETYTDGRANAS